MNVNRLLGFAWKGVLLLLALLAIPVLGGEWRGTVKSVDEAKKRVVITDDATHKDVKVRINADTMVSGQEGKTINLKELKSGSRVAITEAPTASMIAVEEGHAASTSAKPPVKLSILAEFWHNFTHNLFKPLLLFFYLGFLVPIFRVKFEFPYAIYQGLTIYLLLAIGWHGGEELSQLNPKILGDVLGFMLTGFITNFIVGVLAYFILSTATSLRRIDKATVAGYYGSDSAGTFVTCLGVLTTAHIAYDAYMPVMLAIMEIPGCLVALYLVSRLRHQGMDPLGNMPGEPGYDPSAKPMLAEGMAMEQGVELEEEMALEKMEHPDPVNGKNGKNGKKPPLITGKLLHEVFLNTGLYLLFGGIFIGFVSGLQGPDVTRADDSFFVTLFQGVLCLFLLEMGMTASRKLRDLRTAGLGYVLFGLLAPNLFATIGIAVAHFYSLATGTHFELGTYVLFSVLCAAASYIAVPAVQRMAIPEASPTLPLAASLGLTFSYNVTLGIPIYIEIAKAFMRNFPG